MKLEDEVDDERDPAHIYPVFTFIPTLAPGVKEALAAGVLHSKRSPLKME